MSFKSYVCALGAAWLCLGAAPPAADVPPPASADIALSDGRTMHVRDLPLGQVDGVVRDGARFDASGTRVALLAVFPGGAIHGDWRRIGPAQAYVLDVERRTLTALTSDGRARAVRWIDATHVRVTDGETTVDDFVAAPLARSSHDGMRVSAVSPLTSGDVVTPLEEFRLQAIKTSAQTYALGQVGAVRLRAVAVDPSGGYVVAGSFVAWVDARRDGGSQIARLGPDTVLPISVYGDPYGDSLTPLVPLGHAVYQGAYRDGVVYFAFAHGVKRIVAATRDFQNFEYPALPKDPAFTVGDGLGAGGDDSLYFVGPETGHVQYWRGGKYVDRLAVFPDNAGDMHRLLVAMERLAPDDTLWPPMHPDADATDSAMLEWRAYPIGDATGDAWIASHLGRAFIAGSDARFAEIRVPSFPFAVLGRTDDGRLWGVAPRSRRMNGGAIVAAGSTIYESRDGRRWNAAGVVDGDAGAVGIRGEQAWVGMSVFEGDASGVEVARLGDTGRMAIVTGAIYAGEDMFFADLDSGWYLVCGGQPGTRSDDRSGQLTALRLPIGRTARNEARPENEPRARDGAVDLYGRPPRSSEFDAFAAPSIAALRALRSPYRPTLVADALPAVSDIRTMTFDDERRFEIEFAWHPYPLASVSISRDGDDSALVTRRLERGPLAISGQTERWQRGADGTWRIARVISRFSL